MRGRLTLRPLALMSLMLVTGCPGPAQEPTPEPMHRLATVTVTCAPASVSVGQSAQCSASALDQDGQAITVERFTWTSRSPSLGALVAVGTEAQPIRFVAAPATPPSGAWAGLHFLDGKGSRLEHVVLSHAGAKLFDALGGGGVNVYTELGAFMIHTTLQDTVGCGVAVTASVTTDFTSAEYGNSFLNGSAAAQCSQ